MRFIRFYDDVWMGNAEGNKVRLTIEWADSKKRRRFLGGQKGLWPHANCQRDTRKNNTTRESSPSSSTGGTAQDEGKSSERHGEEEEERDILLRRGRSQ